MGSCMGTSFVNGANGGMLVPTPWECMGFCQFYHKHILYFEWSPPWHYSDIVSDIIWKYIWHIYIYTYIYIYPKQPNPWKMMCLNINPRLLRDHPQNLGFSSEPLCFGQIRPMRQISSIGWDTWWILQTLALFCKPCVSSHTWLFLRVW